MTTYDFDLALAKHAMWLTRLKLHTMGVGEPDLTPEKAGDAGVCDLGRWIAAEGAQYHALPGFDLLSAAHRRFHELAAETVRQHQRGDETETRFLLEQLLPEASSEITRILQQLRDNQP